MTVSVFSVFMSALFSVVFILAVHLLRKRDFFLRDFGIPAVLVLCGLCICRMLVSIETPLTIPIRGERVLSAVYTAVRRKNELLPGLPLSILQVFYLVWISGAVITLAIFLGLNLSTLHRLKAYRGNRNHAAEKMLALVKEESRPMSVTVCACPGITVPMGAGVFEKRIYLPSAALSDEELYYVLKHEYAHFLGHDILIKILICLFCCVFWWNPMVYVLRGDIERILEIKADIKATDGFSKPEKIKYLETLLKCVRSSKKAKKRFFRPVARLCADGADQELVERFQVLSAPAARRPAFYPLLLVGISVLVFVGSYLFILQPYYEPPVRDIFENSSVQRIDINEEFIVKHKNGSYSLVLATGEELDIQKATVDIFVSCGTELKEEE